MFTFKHGGQEIRLDMYKEILIFRFLYWWEGDVASFLDAGLMYPRPMRPRPKILGCYAPWTKHPLDIAPLTNVSRPWTTQAWNSLRRPLSRPRSASGALWISGASGRLRLRPWPGLMDWRPSIGCTVGPHIEIHRFAALKRAGRDSWRSGVASLNQIWI
jgi:hypothetical protein